MMLDQRALPASEHYLEFRSAPDVASAISEMVVRGAPAIGIAAAFGVALSVRQHIGKGSNWRELVESDLDCLRASRPTAANLDWAVQRVAEHIGNDDAGLADVVLEEALAIQREDIAMNHEMGRIGSALLGEGAEIVTHCNAGALATGGYGTALGVARSAWESGRLKRVFAGETRPWLQGSRLTAWELSRDGIPVTLVADSAMAQLFRSRHPSWLVVGADRIARNGDVANKIGTYSLAVIARQHGARVMVVAPTSTLDLACPDGDRIPIEERGQAEIWSATGSNAPPEGVEIANPAFDVTPAGCIDVIVTEKGVVERPDPAGIAAMMARSGPSPGG